MDPVLLAGAPVSFDFEMLFYREEGKKPITKHSGTFVWNMGDGNEFIQDWEEEFDYVYEYPGIYTLHIAYTRSDFETEPDYIFQKNITIEKASLAIGMIDEQGGIRIDNQTGKHIDISRWQIRYAESIYVFPENTLIPAGENRFIAKPIHGFVYLFPGSPLSIELLRPTGEVHYKEQVKNIGAIKNENTDNVADIDTEDLSAGESDEITIIDIEEKTTNPQLVLWGVGGISILSLLASLGVALHISRKEETLEEIA